ncbi:Protein disulfide isomerase [Leptomonas seymouri]|uniref:Protein disulfide isomerase n=1 Tax=Leptomonas seymouri TaxID=5684 RepID=A0A0N1I5T9_LEPSE|nr:Protein disulfide isomerase [Leptomonas seymouri]|eukprot:KPI86114.1 Protein disulfide isomerase [Leptomonas seymouri]
MSYMKKVLALFLLAAFSLLCAKADLVELNPENFKSVVNNPKKNVFVMFYAPWCGHCNHMKPDWQKLADEYNVDTDDTVIARVDASAHQDIARDNSVSGFPTMKLFTKKNKSGVQYNGPRDVDSLKAFLKQNIQ